VVDQAEEIVAVDLPADVEVEEEVIIEDFPESDDTEYSAKDIVYDDSSASYNEVVYEDVVYDEPASSISQAESVIREAPPQPIVRERVQEQVAETGGNRSLAPDLPDLTRVYFAQGYAMADRRNAQKVISLAEGLKAGGYKNGVEVTGFANSVGDVAKNQELSSLRAQEVAGMLIHYGVPGEYIRITEGVVETGATSESRRVELRLAK